MNGLSQLIYLADISGRLGGAIIALMILTALVSIGFIIYGASVADCYGDNEEKKRGLKIITTAIFRGIATSVVLLLIMVVTPSREAVYAIAASEVGEEALKSPTATKAIKALDAWLDRQIAPTAPAAE